MSASASPARKTDISDILSDSVRKRAASATQSTTATQVKDDAFANIKANTFFKIMFSPAAPKEKQALVTKELTYVGTKEENRAKLKEFALFKEYLQSEREQMAQEIIKLTDTETFSELKQVYDDLNKSLMAFDNQMKPLTDILDALYKLRTSGDGDGTLTQQALNEIEADKAAEIAYNAAKLKAQSDSQDFDTKVRSLQIDIAGLNEKRGFFGLGGTTEAARVEIAAKNLEIADYKQRADKVVADLAVLDSEQNARQSNMGDLKEAKDQLRNLLDISTEGHKERQRALVDAALAFVNTAKDRVGSVRSHLGKMNDQVEGLFDANSNMTKAYAILNEGIRSAEGENQKLRDGFAPPVIAEGTEPEDLVTKMTREEKKMDIETHMGSLDAAARDTMTTYADLSSQTIRIKGMREANETQINTARAMHSNGIAGVADRLSVVLQAVSSAALGESSAMAKQTLGAMADSTNRVAQKQYIQLAMGQRDQNDDLAKAIADLGTYGEVVRASTDISREAITEMRGKLDELQELARGVQSDIQESVAVHAEVALGLKPTNKAAVEEPARETFLNRV